MLMLVTLSELKSILEIEAATTTFDTLLEDTIVRVSARIETYLNRNLKKDQRVSYFNANLRVLHLSAYPVDISTTFSVILDSVTQTLNTDYYLWEDTGKVEWFHQPVYIEPKQVKITWTGGFSAVTTSYHTSEEADSLAATITDDLKEACLLQCAYTFKRRRDLGLSKVTMPDGAVQTYPTKGFLPEVLETLNRYRKVPTER
jgi:hypothetical protein